MSDDLDRFRGPWFDAKTAAEYIGCKSVRAWYEWRKRHGIVRLANGRVAKVDLDRALKLRPRPRPLAAASLANLERRHNPA